MKYPTKFLLHLNYVATLPCEVRHLLLLHYGGVNQLSVINRAAGRLKIFIAINLAIKNFNLS